jgi:hypothetical protein
MKEIIFEARPPGVGDGIVDGPCLLSEQLPWPRDGDSMPLFHLLSAPALWLVPELIHSSSKNLWISVFISYDRTTFSHYGKMSSDTPDHKDAVVLLHDMTGPSRSEHPNQSAVSKSAKLVAAKEGDDNVASYIDSSPSWVQDPIDIDGFDWVMSIYGPDMDSALDENRGIFSDGVGYVFIKSALDLNSFGMVGKFFLQL